MRITVALAAGLVMAGCQTAGVRPFDGAVGYTFENQSGAWHVSYTDAITLDWQILEEGALAACARETGRAVDSLRLVDVGRNEFSRNVPVSVSYPAGVITTPTGGNGSAVARPETPQTFNQTVQVTRRMAFRQVTAVCQTV
ncbi:hypothetical protein [Marinobacter mangrovi]|uniref:hypothetical protein n=1 Tax=Marinobacter mangrovi TaxID=2803918 RepID=UPI001931C37B|nr:hypothetical protein [Marinobacter mangrovi]